MQPRLQSPGAGLPAFESAWLRILFRFACWVISLNLGLRWFRFEAQKIVALSGKVPAAQGTVPVLIDRVAGIEDSSRYWSVFMVLDHLRIVGEGMTQIVQTLTDDRLFGQEILIQDVNPSPRSGSEAIDRFLKAVEGYGQWSLVSVYSVGECAIRIRGSAP